MSSNQERHRYLVANAPNAERQTEPVSLSELVKKFRADPEMDLLEVLGPEDSPTTLVVAMTDSRAEELRQQFSGRLIIERDAPLNLY